MIVALCCMQTCVGSTFNSTYRDVVRARSAICCMRLPVLESSLLVGLPPHGLSHLSCWRLVSPIRLPSPASRLHHKKFESWCLNQSFVMGNHFRQVTLSCRSHAVLQEQQHVAEATLCCRSNAALQPHCVACRSHTVSKGAIL